MGKNTGMFPPKTIKVYLAESKDQSVWDRVGLSFIYPDHVSAALFFRVSGVLLRRVGTQAHGKHVQDSMVLSRANKVPFHVGYSMSRPSYVFDYLFTVPRCLRYPKLFSLVTVKKEPRIHNITYIEPTLQRSGFFPTLKNEPETTIRTRSSVLVVHNSFNLLSPPSPF